MPTIRSNLKSLRNSRGLSQNEVAEALNVTRQTISSYETGRTEPDSETLKRLADLYNSDIYDVLYGENRTQREKAFLRWTSFGISMLLFLGLLVHSTLFIVNNSFFAVADRTVITSENYYIIEQRLALRKVADAISFICTTVFSLGCLVVLSLAIKTMKTIPLKKQVICLLGLVLAVLIVTFPFALSDKVFGVADYLLPALNVLPCISIVLVAIIVSSTSNLIYLPNHHQLRQYAQLFHPQKLRLLDTRHLYPFRHQKNSSNAI